MLHSASDRWGDPSNMAVLRLSGVMRTSFPKCQFNKFEACNRNCCEPGKSSKPVLYQRHQRLRNLRQNKDEVGGLVWNSSNERTSKQTLKQEGTNFKDVKDVFQDVPPTNGSFQAGELERPGSEVIRESTGAVPEGFLVEKVNKPKCAEPVAEEMKSIAGVAWQVAHQVAEALPAPFIEQASQVAEQVSQVSKVIVKNDESNENEDEFEAYRTSSLPEFRGNRGLDNFDILQDDQGVFASVYDFYTFMMKQRFGGFVTGMFAAPILLCVFFTVLYLPGFKGLALEQDGQAFVDLSWYTLFQIFMFSMSLITGLEPEVTPVSPYTLVLANVNALMAQLMFVFLSGAVFARLSQPSQPIKCSTVAVVYHEKSGRRSCRVLMARYVLAGPQPCELVDVKVELTYKYNAFTRSGTFLRGMQSLKLIRQGSFYLNHGMLVRHIIDEESPLYRRTPEMLKKEDAVVSLSVVGVERSSMQSVFHVQHYCAHDDQIVWNAEFEDMILINKKNRRIVDHSKLSSWKQ